MAIVVKRPLAELDLLDIWDYIADDSFECVFSQLRHAILTNFGTLFLGNFGRQNSSCLAGIS